MFIFGFFIGASITAMILSLVYVSREIPPCADCEYLPEGIREDIRKGWEGTD